MSEPGGRVRLDVARPADVFVARSLATRFARDHGCSATASHEVAIIAGELASNLIRHAVEGVLELEEVSGNVVVRSLDRASTGPIPAPLLALREAAPRLVGDDGTWREGLGCGLGAVRRLSDELRVRRRGDGVLEICAMRRATLA